MPHPRWLACALLGLALSAAAAEQQPAAARVEAVEFPYYLFPNSLWERELVWLKTVGFRTIEFSIPWNWHQLAPGEFDFAGRTSPRRDVAGLLRILRRLGMRAWIRPLPPVARWRREGRPPGSADARAQRAWLKALDGLLATQTARHGGAVAYIEGRAAALDAEQPPASFAIIPADDPGALARSREALTAGKSILWTGVEDSLYPAGWEPPGTPAWIAGAVGLGGEERASTHALRRSAALVRAWSPLVAALRPIAMPKQASGSLPAGVTASQAISPMASGVAIDNRGATPFRGELRVVEPLSRRTLVVPGVALPPGESLWLPLGVSLGPGGLCRDCSSFSSQERIVYATAELLAVEFENGILALEFAAPVAGEAVLQLAREPIGPLLASGKPTEFDWDEKTLRVRLPIPAGKSAGDRVRIGLAIEEPESSAFFSDVRRLVIGRKNRVSTTYSSSALAARSRLRLPQGFTAMPTVKSPGQIDYDVEVPADALHGDWADLALEADGVPLGRARVQLFRPVSIRPDGALALRFGREAELPSDPPIVPVEARSGATVEILIRNNAPEIQTYQLTPSGDGLEFLPARTEISVGAVAERRVSLRVFPKAQAGLVPWNLHVAGAVKLDLPMRLLLVPRDRTVAWSADLDGDGSPEWVLESHGARAVFSSGEGGRWMEWTSKDSGVNLLPAAGVLAGPGTIEVHTTGDTLEFAGAGWKRTARLNGTALEIEQSTPLPDAPAAGPPAERPAPNRAIYRLE